MVKERKNNELSYDVQNYCNIFNSLKLPFCLWVPPSIATTKMQQQVQAKNNTFTFAFNLLISIFSATFSLSVLLSSLKIAASVFFIFWGMGGSYHKKNLQAPRFCIHIYFIVKIQAITQQNLTFSTQNYPIISATMKSSCWVCLRPCCHNSALFTAVALHDFVSIVIFIISFINQAFMVCSMKPDTEAL